MKKGSEFALFQHLGILSFLNQGEFVKHETKLQSKLIEQQEEEIDIFVPKATPPIGFRRVYDHDYLEKRGFEEWQFDTYVVGITKMMTKFKDYVFFLIYEDGENKGYVARSNKEKKWIEQYNKTIKAYNKTVEKQLRKPLYLRYINEPGVDFGKLLYGSDQINSSTDTIVLVEGITDKANVDRWINHTKRSKTVCCCTFGKKLSDAQRVKLLKKIPSIDVTIIFMYDPDAVNEDKRFGLELSYYIEDVRAAFLSKKDPGDLTYDQLSSVVSKAESIHSFSLNKVQKRSFV